MPAGADVRLSELRKVLVRLPGYLRLVWNLEREGRLGRGDRILLALAAAYSISPVDVIPGFIPVLGQLDDLLVLLGALRRTVGRLPPAIREDHLAAVGVAREDLEADYRRVRAAMGYLASRTVRLAGHAAMAGLRAGGRLAVASLRAGGRLAAARLQR